MDIERLRAETPGVDHVLHFNNAGASLQPGPVLDRVRRHLDLEAEQGGYEAEALAAGDLARVYESCARLVGGQPDEVALVENATRAFDMAFYAIPFEPGDVILTTRTEYASNFIAYLQVAKRLGAEIGVVPDDADGQVSVTALRSMLSPRVRLVAFAHVPTNNGLVQPAEAVGQVVRSARPRPLYLLDACQSAGQLPLDVGAIGCDVLSATSRKFLRGPRGAGFLWIRRDLVGQLEPPFLDLHAAEWVSEGAYVIEPTAKRFENWESNVAARLGMGTAVDYALAVGVAEGWERLRALAEELRGRLGAMSGVRVADTGGVKGGIVTFGVEGVDVRALQVALRERGINVTVSTFAHPVLDAVDRVGAGLVRASVHYYNTEDEVERFVRELEEVVRGLRG